MLCRKMKDRYLRKYEKEMRKENKLYDIGKLSEIEYSLLCEKLNNKCFIFKI